MSVLTDIYSAFEKLRLILPPVSIWIADFPIPPYLEGHIVEFLRSFSSSGDSITEEVKGRGYPLTAFDLTIDHSCVSPTLQVQIFNSEALEF